ncbi:MAG: hypothetical protein C4329_02565, partial [Chitinophagaceae bacterium]
MEAAQKMVAMYPENARSFILLGNAYAAQSNFEEARKNYTKVISLEPSSPLGYRELANSYLFEEPRDFK